MIQLLNLAYIRLHTKPHEYEINTRAPNIYLKCCQHLELLIYFEKGLRSFYSGNIGSVGQRAAKLLGVKIRVLKEKSAA